MTKFTDRSNDLQTNSCSDLTTVLAYIDIIEDRLASYGAASLASIPVNIEWDGKFALLSPKSKPRYVLKMRWSNGRLRFHLGSRNKKTGETKWELLAEQDIEILLNVCQVIPSFYQALKTTHPVIQEWNYLELKALYKHLDQGQSDDKRNSLQIQIAKLKKIANVQVIHRRRGNGSGLHLVKPHG